MPDWWCWREGWGPGPWSPEPLQSSWQPSRSRLPVSINSYDMTGRILRVSTLHSTAAAGPTVVIKRSQDPIEFDPSPTSNHWDQLRLTPIQYFYSLWCLRGPFSQFSEIRKLSQLKNRILQKSGLLMQQKLAGLASDYLNINHASIPYNYALQMRWLTSMTRPR